MMSSVESYCLASAIDTRAVLHSAPNGSVARKRCSKNVRHRRGARSHVPMWTHDTGLLGLLMEVSGSSDESRV